MKGASYWTLPRMGRYIENFDILHNGPSWRTAVINVMEICQSKWILGVWGKHHVDFESCSCRKLIRINIQSLYQRPITMLAAWTQEKNPVHFPLQTEERRLTKAVTTTLYTKPRAASISENRFKATGPLQLHYPRIILSICGWSLMKACSLISAISTRS